MRIRLILPQHQARQWHRALIDALQARGHDVHIQWRAGNAPSQPRGIAALLMLEDALFGKRAHAMTAQVDAADMRGSAIVDNTAEICFDLAPAENNESEICTQPCWHLEFNGHEDESALWAALLDGRAPFVRVINTKGVVAGSALPAIENPQRLGASADQLFARVISLIVAVAEGAASAATAMRPDGNSAVAHRSPTHFFAAALSEKIIRRIKRITGDPARWRTGYRFLREGEPRVIEAARWPHAHYRAVPDDGARYYADPFPVEHEGRHFLFLEEYPYATGKGILSVADIQADGGLSTPRPCLETESHLSYPQIFRHRDQFYMIPESCAANRIDLYRATEFPFGWQYEATLVADVAASDCTIINHAGRWWLLGTVAEFGGSTWDCLHAWHADDLHGPWRTHPANPLLIDASCARPAGAMVKHNGEILRPVQNCLGGYGAGLGIAALTRLDESGFHQELKAQLTPDPRWNASGVHTLNDNGVIEAIDFFA